MRRIIAIVMTILLIVSGLPVYKAEAAAYDPVTKTEGSKTLDLRFWEDKKPDIGFYINAGNRYLLETVTEPQFGTSSGEWSVMDLLRGYYTGSDYLNYVPENYYEDYLQRVERYVIAKAGNLDNNKSTEWSRSTLSLSALGKDIRSVGEAGDYLYVKFVSEYRGEKTIDTGNMANNFALKLDGDTVVFDQEYGVEFSYTSQRTSKAATGFTFVPAGTYTLDRDTMQLYNEDDEIVVVPLTEMYSAKPVTTHEVSTITAKSFLPLPTPYDYVEKLSKDYNFSYRQGINGPIWILIALETAGYELYTKEELAERGITVTDAKLNTKGKLIDYILGKEITTTAGRVGGWALTGKAPDPDITMMAIQGLAPFYLDEEKFKNAYRTTLDSTTKEYFDVESDSFKEKYINFKKAVERAIVAMSEDQQPNGAFKSMNITNSESTVQVIVGLTALGMDPLAESIHLPTIDKSVSFIKEGGEYDGVWTNNPIDALIAFWSLGSGSSSEVGGFKHVATGDDSGGGAGTVVNGMATDQAIYGLISYDRFLKNENRLYDMTDMINGEYKTMKAKQHNFTYVADGVTVEEGTFSPYEVIVIPEPPTTKEGYKAVWTTNTDGTGAVYKPGEKLSTPDHAITLYLQYVVPYEITYELNEGAWLTEDGEQYSPATSTLTLPTAEHIQKDRHLFLGWYKTADFQGEAITALSDPTQLEHTLYAKWVSYETLLTGVQNAIAAIPSTDTITIDVQSQLLDIRNQIANIPEHIHQEIVNMATLVEAENMLLVAKAKLAIEQIPAEQSISTADTAVIELARKAYNEVPATHSAKVDTFNILARAEDLISIFNVEAAISTLPTNVNLTHISLFENVTAVVNALPGNLQVEVRNLSDYQSKFATLQALKQQATDIDLANAVRTLIEALPATATLQDREQIELAVQAYKALSDAQKALIEVEYPKLQQLEQQLATLIAEQQLAEYNAALNALPTVDKLKITDEEKVMHLYELYNNLPSDLQSTIDEKQVYHFVAALIDLKIAALPTATTDQDKGKLDAVRTFYLDMPTAIQQYVTKYNVLTQKYVDLENYPKIVKANAVAAKINLIPSTVTTAAKSVIEAARSAYDALTVEERAFVKNATKLTQAENAYIMLVVTEQNELVEATTLFAAINQLPTTITLDNRAIVIDLQNKYNTLTDRAKALVKNANTLAKAVQKINELEKLETQTIQALQSAIASLPEASKITLAHKAVINDVRTKYNSLTAAQKTKVNAEKLVAAEKALAILEKTDEQATVPPNTNTEASSESDSDSQQPVTEVDNSLVMKPTTNGKDDYVIIPQRLVRSTNASTVDVETTNGIRASLPVNMLKQVNATIRFAVNINNAGLNRKVNISLEAEENGTYAKHRVKKPFTIRIPASTFTSPITSLETITSDNKGVILGYSETKGYYAVPHTYKNGEFIVSVSESHQLVHSSNIVTFDDIENSSFKPEIEYLATRLVIKGYSDSSFKPNQKITRGQFASLLSRALDLKPSKTTAFTDAEKSSYKDDIQAVYETGIMRGYSSTTFGVNDPLTREQAATTMARVLEYMDYDAKRNLVHYTDREQINKEHLKAVELLNTLDVMSGDQHGAFNPKNHLTRGQLAKILKRTLSLTDTM